MTTKAGTAAALTGDEFSFTTHDGIRLAGARRGEGPTVVLLHGGFQTHGSWRAGADTLIEQGYEVIAYDLRGHGDSDRAPDGDYEDETHARDLGALLDELPGPVALVGASLGGMTGLLAAADLADRPGSVAAVVLVDVVPRLRADGRDRIRRFMTARPEGFDSLDEAADLVAEYLGGRRPRAGSGLTRSLRQTPDGRYRWHWDPRILERGFDGYEEERIQTLLAAAARVTAPTLVLRGELSDVVGPEGVAELMGVLRDGTFEEVPAVGHMVAATPNSPYVDATSAFLRTHLLDDARGAVEHG